MKNLLIIPVSTVLLLLKTAPDPLGESPVGDAEKKE
jgi:hypothetical protein